MLLLFMLLLFGFPSVAAEPAGKHPQGGAHGCAAFFAV